MGGSNPGVLERAKPGNDGLTHPEKIKRLNVCVGKESIQRAMLIWDRILKAIEASKFKIRTENAAWHLARAAWSSPLQQI